LRARCGTNHAKTEIEKTAKYWRYLMAAQDLHVIVLPKFGGQSLFHTVRSSVGAGSWGSSGDVFAETGPILDTFGNKETISDVSCALNADTGELHVVAVTSKGDLFHALRKADGTWTKFSDLASAMQRPLFPSVAPGIVRIATA
jgi:hypothetical protein